MFESCIAHHLLPNKSAECGYPLIHDEKAHPGAGILDAGLGA